MDLFRLSSTITFLFSASAIADEADTLVLQEKSGGNNVMMIAIIGVVVVLVIVGLVFLIKKMAKAKAEKTLAQKIKEAEKVLRNESNLLDKTPIAGPSVLSTRNFDQFANETEVDEQGRNPSGLIIDEDKYFGSGSTEFKDEDKN